MVVVAVELSDFSLSRSSSICHMEKGKLYFAFTASYSIPLISLTMEEHRLDPEAFWIHGCVFLALILETTH